MDDVGRSPASQGRAATPTGPSRQGVSGIAGIPNAAGAPQTGVGIMMQSLAEHQEEARKRRIAMASASRALNEHFKPEEVEDMRDARRMAMRAAEFAAYYAIEAMTEQLASDMAMVRRFADAQLSMKLSAPANPVVLPNDWIAKPAQGMETRRAATTGAVGEADDSPVAVGDAP
jgi:hypothetical protein